VLPAATLLAACASDGIGVGSSAGPPLPVSIFVDLVHRTSVLSDKFFPRAHLYRVVAP